MPITVLYKPITPLREELSDALVNRLQTVTTVISDNDNDHTANVSVIETPLLLQSDSCSDLSHSDDAAVENISVFSHESPESRTSSPIGVNDELFNSACSCDKGKILPECFLDEPESMIEILSETVGVVSSAPTPSGVDFGDDSRSESDATLSHGTSSDNKTYLLPPHSTDSTDNDLDEEIPGSIKIRSMVTSPFPLISSHNSGQSDLLSLTSESECGAESLEYTSVASTSSVNSEADEQSSSLASIADEENAIGILDENIRISCEKESDSPIITREMPGASINTLVLDCIPVPSAVIRRDSAASLSSSGSSSLTEVYYSECQVMTFQSAEDSLSTQSSICSDSEVMQSVYNFHEMKKNLFSGDDVKEYMDLLQSMEIDTMSSSSVLNTTNCDLIQHNEFSDSKVDIDGKSSNIKAFVDSQIRVAIAKTLVSEQISLAMCNSKINEENFDQKSDGNITLSSNTLVSENPTTISSYPSSEGEFKIPDVSSAIEESKPVHGESLQACTISDSDNIYSIYSSSNNSLSSKSPGEVDIESHADLKAAKFSENESISIDVYSFLTNNDDPALSEEEEPSKKVPFDHIEDLPEGSETSALSVQNPDYNLLFSVKPATPSQNPELSSSSSSFSLDTPQGSSTIISESANDITFTENAENSSELPVDNDLLNSTPKTPSDYICVTTNSDREAAKDEVPMIVIDPSSEGSGTGARNQIYSDSSSLSEEDGFCESEAMQSILDRMTGISCVLLSNSNQPGQSELQSSSFSSSSMSTIEKRDETDAVDSSEIYPYSTDETEDLHSKENGLASEAECDSSVPETTDSENVKLTPKNSEVEPEDICMEQNRPPVIVPVTNHGEETISQTKDVTDQESTSPPDEEVTDQDHQVKLSNNDIMEDSLDVRTSISTPKTQELAPTTDPILPSNPPGPSDKLFLKTKWPKRDPVAGKSFTIACKVRISGFTLKDKDVKNNASVCLYRDNELLSAPGTFVKGYFVHKIKKPTVSESGCYRYVVNLLSYEASEERELTVVPKGSISNVRSMSSIGSLGSLGSLFSLNNKPSRVEGNR